MARKQQIRIEQRRALRTWAHDQHPRPSQKACIEWFYQQFSYKISQSTVSESLSNHFGSLDNSAVSSTERIRVRAGQWPDIEKLLYSWQLHVEEKGSTTSSEIQQKAQQIWRQLPHYSGQPCPKFGVSWVRKFRKRHNITQHTQHGEAGSVPATEEEEEEKMGGIRTLAEEYQEADVYNMDETGLFWKMSPSRGLATTSIPGLKKDKTLISLALCSNANGTDRVPPWAIGNAKTPRALRNISVSTMGLHWRWNKKAWMNTAIMVEWLQAFYTHIGSTRQVLLTMDNFKAHHKAIELQPAPANIRVCWLPANSTSRFQPLDQGIIQSFKSHYRRQWLSFMLECYDSNQNPLNLVNIHFALRWIIRSWSHFVTNTTIYNCFRKSTLVVSPISLPTPIDSPDISRLYEQVVRAGNIQDVMAISNFLNPVEEAELVNEQEIIGENMVLQEVIAGHSGFDQEEDDEEALQPERSIPSIKAARGAIQLLIDFTEGRDDMNTLSLRVFEKIEQDLEALYLNSRV